MSVGNASSHDGSQTRNYKKYGLKIHYALKLSNKVIIAYKNNIPTVINKKSNQLELFYGKINNI